jgi:hypothetical protein
MEIIVDVVRIIHGNDNLAPCSEWTKIIVLVAFQTRDDWMFPKAFVVVLLCNAIVNGDFCYNVTFLWSEEETSTSRF